MRDLAGKTAFITGGASGIGLGMAKVFAWAGMNVAIRRALGEDKAREAVALELIPGLVGSPIDNEAP
jgi:NAD(P)-dependent dehydrogenase (short-subunit alcohol dehydrogenase family)